MTRNDRQPEHGWRHRAYAPQILAAGACVRNVAGDWDQTTCNFEINVALLDYKPEVEKCCEGYHAVGALKHRVGKVHVVFLGKSRLEGSCD